MKPEARQRNARLRAAAVDPSAGEGATASGPPGAFDGPESRPLAERCLLGFNSTAGSALAAELLLQQPQADRADPRHGADPERDGARRARRPHRRQARAADHPQLDGRFDRLVGRRHARRRHHEFHGQDAVQRVERSTARRRTHHARRTRTRSCIASRSRIRRRGIVRGPASIRGRRPRSVSTSTPVTKATTRCRTCCGGARFKEAEDAAKKQE